MSISSRITSMGEHVTNAYNGLAGLGADLTGIDKNIDNIASVLDDIYDDLPKVTGSGTSITLDDTRKGRLESTLSGNTSQFTTTGINLAKVDYSFNQTTNGITCKVNSDGSISLSGTASANTTFIMSTGLGYSSGTYAMSCVGMPTNSDSIRIRFRNANATYSEGDSSNTAEIVYNQNPRTFTNRDVNDFEVFVFSGATLNSTIKVQLQTGSSATSFEPYTGGTASPNPSYPQPVNVVSGDNEINIEGLNLEQEIELGGINQSGVDYPSTTSIRSKYYNNVSPNKQYIYSMNNNVVGINVLEYDKNKSFLSYTYRDSVFTTSANTYYVRFVKNATMQDKIQLQAGSSATTYEPYQGNTYNIDLPEGMELCKIGTYQDYFYKDNGNWYKYGMVGKGVLNGSETWYRGLTNTTDYYRFFVDFGTNIQSGGASLKANVYSNKFIGITRDQSYGRNQGIAPTDTNYTYKSLIIYCEDTAQMTIADFKTWLSNNPTTVYYVYATPTITQITYQPLIDQLNELEKAQSKENQTNISQVNNDLPFIISASALKEWQESTSLNSTLSMVNPLSLGNTLNTQENNTQPIEVDNIEPLEEEENE